MSIHVADGPEDYFDRAIAEAEREKEIELRRQRALRKATVDLDKAKAVVGSLKKGNVIYLADYMKQVQNVRKAQKIVALLEGRAA